VCKCVLLPPGVNPIAVKYIISYHIMAARLLFGVHGTEQSLNLIFS
jgi:hypothetical protein